MLYLILGTIATIAISAFVFEHTTLLMYKIVVVFLFLTIISNIFARISLYIIDIIDFTPHE